MNSPLNTHLSYIDKFHAESLLILGRSYEPCDSHFLQEAITTLGYGTHSCGDNLGFIDIVRQKESTEIYFYQNYTSYNPYDFDEPKPKSVTFKNDCFQLVLRAGGYGIHRVYELDERIEVFKYIKKKTLLATWKESEKHYKAIYDLPLFGMDMWP